jgi:hypothetical protein
MEKATKEGKVHTSWINPNEEYDTAVRTYTERLLADQGDPFLLDLLPLQRRLPLAGDLREHVETLPDVFAAFRVMRGGGEHGVGPAIMPLQVGQRGRHWALARRSRSFATASRSCRRVEAHAQ